VANNYPYFPFYVSDFDGDTRHMSVESIGIYIRLLIYQWTNGKIPGSEAMMIRIAGCGHDQFMESWENEIGQCFEKFEDGSVTSYRNKRLQIERDKVLASTEQRRQAGINSGKSRRKTSRKPPKKQAHRTSVPFPFERGGNEKATIQSHNHNHSKDKPISRFEEFWQTYPKKAGKKPCSAKWKARRLDRLADKIIQNVRDRIEGDSQWLRGFVPNPLTFINQDRWDDPIQKETAGEKTQRSRTDSFDDIHAKNREKAGLD
jgi:uncharacterized protein YdaU (DUF1376 family)